MGTIELYHGSNLIVDNPKILKGLRALDFGEGFYLTSSAEQAMRWARTVTRRRDFGHPILNTYELNSLHLSALRVLRFEAADESWLDFVVQNRRGQATTNGYDIVIGPVANDSTLPVIDDYMAGVYTKDEAVKRLLPQNLTDQYAFKSEAAINTLIFRGATNL